jgi:chemotaxis protein histidine kinase CheA
MNMTTDTPQDTTTTTPQTTPTPATAPDSNAGNTPATFTQADVDRIVGERAKRASEAAITKLLADLGIESADTLKAEIDAKRKRDEAELSEMDKLTKQLEALKADKEAAETRAQQADAKRLEAIRDGAIMRAIGSAEHPTRVMVLLQAEHADKVTAVLGEDGTVDEAALKTLGELARKEYAGEFKASGGPGSGSHNGGRTPAPDKKNLLDQLPKLRL